jgi:glycine betaine catabolism B
MINPLNLVDGFLNHVTMYRLVLYYVGALLLGAVALGFFALVPHDPAALVFSAVFIGVVCWLSNWALARILKVPANTDSIYITAGIVALIMPPVLATDMIGLGGLALASAAAIASKFLLAVHRKHIFNPVALGVTVSAYALDQPATWWVGGNLELLPLVFIGGFLVLRKVQRFQMFGVYVLANFLATAATTSPDMFGEAFMQTIVYSPLFFAGFAMLTEPLTAPADLKMSLVFGAIVGALSSPSIHIGEFYFTPEVAFLVGNVFAWVVSPKFRYKLTLEKIEKKAQGAYDYVFHSNRPLSFAPGQYLDWTMHLRSPDSRGNRRAFTIASSPNESRVRLGVKFYPHPSAFKQGLLNLKPGDQIYASQLAGEFILPRSADEKLAFIAGGIGVTPFRSMVQHMVDTGDGRSVVMFYGNNRSNEIAYADVFSRAEQAIDLRTIYAVAETDGADTNFHRGFIDADMIKREMPDFGERLFYISGPRSMVTKFQKALGDLGIHRSRIKTDFFPGFA